MNECPASAVWAQGRCGSAPKTVAVPRFRGSAEPFLAHALVATFAVIVLPALAVSLMDTSGRPLLVLSSVLLAMVLSVATASVGSAIWSRRPHPSDVVFNDLMLWGWVRRVRAERRLAQAQGLLSADASGIEERGLSPARRRRILQRLAAMLEAKDPDTLGHSRRVTRHAERIAREMGLPREDVARIRVAASVHDIGKVHTPRELLTKPGNLTPEEFAVMQRHSLDGARMVAELGDPRITSMVRHHHERLDGSGYPDGLRGEEIPLGARIISVADTFDAITSNRAYQSARNHRRGLELVSESAGSRLDPDAVAAFLRYYSGKRAVVWSALGLTGPPRLVNWLGGVFNGIGGLASPLAQSFAAIAAAAIAGASLGGHPAPATAAGDQVSRDPAPAPTVSHAPTAVDPSAGGRGRGRSTPTPVRNQPVERPRQDAPDNGSRGEPALPDGTDGTGGTAPADPLPVPVPDVPVPGDEGPLIEVPDIKPPVIQLPDLGAPELAVPNVALPAVELPELRLRSNAPE
jgi:putative nucleotidyltransferase with HDIG domain